MSKAKVKFILFSIGAVGYGLMEIIWRGYTHWSMLTAGGICFVSFSNICDKMKNSCIWFKALAGGAFITAIEFIYGIIFNIILKKDVWNYSKLPLNIGGQICLLYSFIWTVLSTICVPFSGYISKKLSKNK